MMNNEAAPSYFNGGNMEQYIDYRHDNLPDRHLIECTIAIAI